jgi:predicted permease
VSLLQDIRFAVRLLIKDKWFTLVAVVALALGIGVNATVFTFVNAVLIRGLPFNDPDRIMSIAERQLVRGTDLGVSYPDFQDWRAAQKSFVALAAWSGSTMNVSDAGRLPERYGGPYISATAFRLIGQQPILGRNFLPEEDKPGAAPVAILGSGIWKSRYGSDPAILGRTIKINDVPTTVVGVMPEGMKFPLNADLWLPLSAMPGLDAQKRSQRSLQAFGRLADGVTKQQAQAELSAIAARIAKDFPDANKDIGATVMSFNERFNGGPIRLVFLSLMGAVGFVLLIACANVANLLLARSAQRAREIGVRVSLGATRWRIVRQLLVESVLLALASGVLGLVLALAGTRWFEAATADVGKPYWIRFTMDGSVFAFFAAVCLATGIVFGLAPALHISRTDINEVLKESGGRSGGGGSRARRWTGALIVVELALTLVLLAGAGFMIRSFLSLYTLDLGLDDTSRLLTLSLSLPDRKYPTPEQRAAFYQRSDERLAVMSGVRGATITSNPPLNGGANLRLNVEGRSMPAGEQPPEVTRVVIGPHYFDTFGLRILRGRVFTDGDGTTGHEVAIVNQRFVAMHFPNQDPIGQRIRLMSEPPATPEPPWATIVGISPTVWQRVNPQPDPDPVVYLPYRALPSPFMTLVVRTVGEPALATAAIREEVRALDPDLPLFGIRTMDESLAQQRWPFRIFGTMFAMFAVIALMLSAVGLYAITAYSVTQRTQEIGVRMALGARPPQVWWLVVRGTFVQLAIGLTIGMAGAFGVGQLLRTLLVGTTASDPWTLGSIGVLFVIVSLAACFWPARRATRLDPVHALRYE